MNSRPGFPNFLKKNFRFRLKTYKVGTATSPKFNTTNRIAHLNCDLEQEKSKSTTRKQNNVMNE